MSCWESLNSFGILMGYMLDGRCSIPGRNKERFTNLQHLGRLRGPSRLLNNCNRGQFHIDKHFQASAGLYGVVLYLHNE
jgi:hypothetical protein